MDRLSGRRAIVTGAGSGIGRAGAIRFAAEGARVLLVGRNEQNLTQTAQIIRKSGGRAATFVADVTVDENVAQSVSRCIEEFGGLEIFYANAGSAEKTTSFFDLTLEDWEGVFRGNVISSFLAVKHAGKYMASQGRGSIILMSSAGSLRGNGGPFAYCAAKASVNYIAQGAANVLAGTNVRVNVILSGLVETNMTRATFEQARSRGVENKIGHITPLKRPGKTEEIAAVAAFLASDDSAFIDGQLIAADGGFSSTHPYGRVSV